MKKIASISFIILLCLIALEILLSAAEIPIKRSKEESEEAMKRFRVSYNKVISSFEPDLGYKMPPDLDVRLEGHPDYSFGVRSNPLIFKGVGFRDDGLDKEAYAVAIGDSFVWGYGVEESDVWTEVLEARLNKDISNLGMPGFSALQYGIMLRKYGLALKPKIVLIGFFTGNDYGDSLSFQEWRDAHSGKGLYTYFADKEKKKDNLREEAPKRKLSRLLQKKSALYRFLREIDFKDSFKARQRTLKIKGGELQFDVKMVMNNINGGDADNFAKGWEITRGSLKDIKRICLENSVVLFVVLIPSKEEVYSDYIAEKLDFTGEEKNKILAHYLNAKEFCGENGVESIDLLPEFKKRANAGEKLYFTHDGHWNKEGHLLAASIVYNYLNGK